MSNLPICRYYLRGECKYGSHCRFRHTFPDNRKDTNDNHYGSPFRMENQSKLIDNKLEDEKEYADVLNELRKEILRSEQSGEWSLTSFGYGEYGPVYGFTDLSPEEVRYLYHASIKNGTVNKFDECYKNLQKTSWELRNHFKNKTDKARKIVMDLCSGKKKDDISDSPYAIIAKAIQPVIGIDSFSFAVKPLKERTNTQPDDAFHTFSFTSTGAQVQNSNPFGNIQPANFFGSNPKNIQPDNFFGSNPKNIVPSNFFGSNSKNNEPANVFGSNSKNHEPSNVFNRNPKNIQPANVFGNNSTVSIQQSTDNKINSKMYSSIGDLSKEEVDAFNAPVFEYGKVPLSPPPDIYC